MSTKTYYYVFEPDSITDLPEMRSFEAKDFGADRIQATGNLPDLRYERTFKKAALPSHGIYPTADKALDGYTNKLQTRLARAHETIDRSKVRMTQLPLQATSMAVKPAKFT